jgi:lipopolysaccharide export system permease protein
MIFQRAVRREFAHSTAGVFIALFAIMVTTQLIRLLNEAAQGDVDPAAVVALLGFAALNYLPPLLSLSMFVAILLSISRSYRDSEMVVWFSSGLSLTAWVRPVLTFALPLVVTIGVLSLLLSPWALSQSAEYRGKLSNRKDAGQISPGTFQESSAGDRVIFVEAVAEDTSHVRNVFVNEAEPERLGVTMARTGHQETAANGDRFIVLENGRRYELEPGAASFRILEYERYAVRLETKEAHGIQSGHRRTCLRWSCWVSTCLAIGRSCYGVSACRCRRQCWLCWQFHCPSSIRVRDVRPTCSWRFWFM